MNTLAITEAAQATLAGTRPFPEIVAKLIATGVEYYHVDDVGLSKQYYDGAGARVVTPIPLNDLPRVAPELDVTALRAAILDSQTKCQSWPRLLPPSDGRRRAKLLRLPPRPARHRRFSFQFQPGI